MNDVVYLVTEITEEDVLGNNIVKERTETAVFCEILSAGQQEFLKAATVGFKPQYRVKLWKQEYSGQSVVRIEGDCYSVYRTFILNEFAELYLERRVGEQ